VVACLHVVEDQETFELLSLPASAADQRRAGKWLIGLDPALPPLVVNSRIFDRHSSFLKSAFPDVFPGIDQNEYVDLVHTRPRLLYSGKLNEYQGWYGFSVWDDPANADTTTTYEEVLEVWLALDEVFFAPIAFVPNSNNQREAAAFWQGPFEVREPGEVYYETYNEGVGYGTVRVLSLVDLAAAEADASFGFQDILVLDEAPVDVERPVSGYVTGSRQGELSHLNVRALARGTPNCHISGAHEAMASWENELVRFECAADTWTISAADSQDAQDWWASLVPDPVDIPAPDLSIQELEGLLALDTSTEDARTAGMAAFGSKGTNLATLYQRVPQEVHLDGFLVPFFYYDAFMKEQGWDVDLGAGQEWNSFSDTVEAWHGDVAFMTDAAQRRERLEALRSAIDDAPKNEEVLSLLASRIDAVFGSNQVMVRFRSSSNAEDALEFSGAGLYDSTSVCAADLGGEPESACDSDSNPRSIERGLGRVWSSLWSTAAWEERQWYGIDHSKAAMGLLVNTRSKDEQANIVAFTGIPGGDDRYLVNAQVGWLDVVSADVGTWPEKVLLTVDTGGVSAIERIRESSETAEVLDDTRLEELGGALLDIQTVFPVDGSKGRVLLDTEWKVLEDGRLIIKQIRPFSDHED
jgi:pyruvate, water dikinase